MAKNGHLSIGRLGEDIISGYLRNRGYRILDCNYREKWGELDIVAKKDSVLHFVEVKAGSWNKERWPQEGENVHRPEDHMHKEKCARMKRAIQTYMAEKRISVDSNWTVDLAVVLLNEHTRKARVRWLWDVVL